jgi:anti-anti-sigma factor
MLIHTQSHEGTTTLTLEGKFTFECHGPFKDAAYPVLQAPGMKALHLNLAAVSYMDSSSLGMLLLLREKAEAVGIKVRLERPSPNALSILKAVQFGKLFEILEG